jgi:hypothetical protein
MMKEVEKERKRGEGRMKYKSVGTCRVGLLSDLAKGNVWLRVESTAGYAN